MQIFNLLGYNCIIIFLYIKNSFYHRAKTCDTMNAHGSIGITAAVIILTSLLVGATAGSLLMQSSDSFDIDLEQFADDAVNEVSTYLVVKDIIGKYSSQDQGRSITQIVMLVTPMFHGNVDISGLSLQLNNGEDICVLTYGDSIGTLSENRIFSHSLWQNLPSDSFGLIVLNDDDDSVETLHCLNDPSDTVYVIIQLPSQYQLTKDDTMILTILPKVGVQRSFFLEAPLSMSAVVSFF